MRKLTSAERLLQRSYGVTKPREIDLEAIAFDQGAKVKYRELDGCEARIVGRNKAIITINPSRSHERMRFSIAHELGHWYHHRGKRFDCRASDIGRSSANFIQNMYEKQANRYASDLIMPAYLFRPLAQDYKKTTFENVKKLADAFQTSITATAIRMVELGPEPAMLVRHNQKGRKQFWSGTDIPQRWYPQEQLDADSYAMDVLHGNQRQSSRVLTDGSVWFDRHGAEHYELYEQAFRVVDNEVLVLLVFKDNAMLEDY